MPPLEIHVRPALPTDLSTLHPLINTSYRSSQCWTNEHSLVKDERIPLSALSTLITTPPPNSTILVASSPSDHSTIYGCIQISEIPTHNNEADIGLFAVSPSVQSQGVGKRLLQAACDYARDELGKKVAVLHVISVRRELLDWYCRFGFTETGEREQFVWPELALIPDMQFSVLKKDLV
ncbi:hypothetical protein HK097_009028 [Rhizophlyctis rosea]|uniref:N-acetyltransferase domain-containing protein n=1 Tax=Rhizophlyctis rosea TaxID=64517 RepID=A0AAD5X464_9FUNG|nr:hypothetical protein HK097_009028 [Rhizophlyctis rosea]